MLAAISQHFRRPFGDDAKRNVLPSADNGGVTVVEFRDNAWR